jgi:diguanylate cyclase (GGDEF)-like protein
VARAELPVAPPDAPPRWLRVTAALVVIGERRCLLSHVEDATEGRLAEQSVAELPMHDGLTGLPDRALLADRLALARDEDATTGLCTGLLRVDLHDFAHVNEVLGRDDGDAVLVAIARRLTGLVRADDTVARVGGVAFAVLARDLPDQGALEGLAGRLARGLAEPLDVGTARLRIGVAVAGDLVRAADSFATALLRAEQALTVVRRESRRAAEIDLRETDLRETDLRETDLRETDLRQSDQLGGDPHGVAGGRDAEVRGGERRETAQRPA